MAPGKTVNRSLAGLEEKPAKDYDPEGDTSQTHLNDTESEESENELAGTEHYLSVGTSKLRKKDVEEALGPQYRGARVSRAALDAGSDEGGEGGASDEDDDASSAADDESGSEEFDDPDTADLEADWDGEDVEIDSDNALGESDMERFKDFTFKGSSKPKAGKGKSSRATAADFFSGSEDEGSDDEQLRADVSESSDDSSGVQQNGARISDDDSDEEDDGSEGDAAGSDEDDLGEESEDADSEDNSDGDDERAELRKIMKEGQKSIMATMSQAAKADAEKGIAVRQQRRAFDSLLNIRIRLQKALVATNSFSAVEGDDSAEAKEPYEAAEEAAVKLWSSIDGFRRSLLPESAKAKVGEKRKRDIDAGSTDQHIWKFMEEMEELALGHRRKVLDKWSAKVRNTITTTRKLGPSTSQSLVSVLDDQLLSADRLVKRTQTPRSCAPVQAAQKVAEDPAIYDDADFYQLLLKELVDQRTMDSSAMGGGGAGTGATTVRWAALKEAKTRKQVDRKASKGRKLRFTVHEKLQNFAAPEDRRDWEQDAIDRFFGTLFGQRMELKEGEESDEEMGGVSLQDEGLRLFAN